MKISQKMTAGILVICMTALAAISVGAVSDVKCIGGGGTNYETHKYGFLWLKSHDYAEFYHDVDRVYDSIIYGTSGHDASDCKEEDFYDYCAPGTVVGQG